MPRWNDIMNRVLPLSGNRTHHMGSPYGEVRPVGSSPHGGIDFNYTGGQTGINLTHPPLYAPVGGMIVGRVGGPVGTISIRDNNGYIHQILHTEDRYVRTNDKVVAGQPIGTMGGTGAPKNSQHVHYQVRAPRGRVINPETYWNGALGVPPPEVDDAGATPLPRPRPAIAQPSAVRPDEKPRTPADTTRGEALLPTPTVTAPAPLSPRFAPSSPALNARNWLDPYVPRLDWLPPAARGADGPDVGGSAAASSASDWLGLQRSDFGAFKRLPQGGVGRRSDLAPGGGDRFSSPTTNPLISMGLLRSPLDGNQAPTPIQVAPAALAPEPAGRSLSPSPEPEAAHWLDVLAAPPLSPSVSDAPPWLDPKAVGQGLRRLLGFPE